METEEIIRIYMEMNSKILPDNVVVSETAGKVDKLPVSINMNIISQWS